MIKPNQTSSANLNVLGESDLTQVVGGCGYRRNYRRRHHCWGWRQRFDHGHEGGGFQSRGSDDSFDSEAPELEDPSSGSDDTSADAPV